MSLVMQQPQYRLLQAQQGGTIFGFIVGLLTGLILAVLVTFFVSDVEFTDNSNGSNAAGSIAPALPTPNSQNLNAGLLPHNQDPPPTSANTVTPVVVEEVLPIPDLVPDLVEEVLQPKTAEVPVEQTQAEQENTVQAGVGYYIQAGAFQNKPDAETQQAKLAFLGEKGIISQHTRAQGTVYRVRVGPFNTRSEARKTRDRIQESGIDAIVLNPGQ